ncbi:MAG: AI-2E family transporter [Pseudomonadota bacterium]
MEHPTDPLGRSVSEAMTTSLIRLSLIALLVIVCSWAFSPFLPIMLWALVLAVSLYPLQRLLESKLGGASGRAATLIVVSGLLLIGIPTAMMGSSFAGQIFSSFEAFSAGTVIVPEPAPDVADWPIIGERLSAAWSAAATDLPAFLETLQPQLANFANWILGVAGSTAGIVLELVGALIIAGIMLAWAEAGSRAIRKIFVRLSGAARGPQLLLLATRIIRQVATGIIGVAFVTAMLLGIVFFVAGVPWAGVLSLIALFLGIMQIPVSLVALVGIAYLWMSNDGAVLYNTIFTVLMIAASLSDNVMKPLVLGRGLDVPMPVVLIGALGGMVSGGILGMFIGATFLAAGYQVFMEWVDSAEEAAPADATDAERPKPASPAA